MQSLRVLITGANGYIGKRLAGALAKEGHSVFGISLEGQPVGSFAQYRQVDVSDATAVANLLGTEAFDAVIHLAAIVHVRRVDLSFADYARVNFRASESLFHLAAQHGVRRILFASTVEVYGPVENGAVVDEQHVCRPDSDYARTKLLAEESLFRVAQTTAAACCAMRFAPVYAPDFRLNVDKRLYLRAPDLGYRLGSGDYRLNCCAVRNIETWVTRWLADEQPPSGIFNLADTGSLSVRELHALERRHGRARIIIPLPAAPSLAALAARELAYSVAGRDVGIHTVQNFRKLLRSTTWSNAKTVAALGELPGAFEVDLYSNASQ